MFCWLCDRTQNNPPRGWYAPFTLEIAHIASGQGRARRVDDARAVVLLDSRCHRLHVSDADALPYMTINGKQLPTCDERHTLYAKRLMDHDNYDIEFLKTIWIGNPPEPERPPAWYQDELFKNIGVRPPFA